MIKAKELVSNDNDPLFKKDNMMKRVFPSDYRQIHYYTLLVVQSAPQEGERLDLLRQQVSEIIKNAIKHGNHCDTSKKVTIWYSFSNIHAHVIVEDEGEGFKDMEKWNEFNRKRVERLEKQDFDGTTDWLSFKTQTSGEDDNGNALCAAVEFWDGGFVFNKKRNAVAMLKRYK